MRSNFHEGRWWMSVARGRGTLLEADDTIVSGEAVRVTCSSWRRRGKKKKKKNFRRRQGKRKRKRERKREREDRRVERNTQYMYTLIYFRDNFSLVWTLYYVIRWCDTFRYETLRWYGCRPFGQVCRFLGSGAVPIHLLCLPHTRSYDGANGLCIIGRAAASRCLRFCLR